MTEEVKDAGLPEELVIRLLEQQSRYGIDQETMLIYINSVNLMSILSMINRRYGSNPNLSLTAPATMPTLTSLTPGVAPGNSPALNDLIGMLMKMLGNQGGGNSLSGQGINPAMLMSLLGALGGQNVDLGGLMNKLAGLIGSGTKQVSGFESGNVAKPASSGETSSVIPGVMIGDVNTKTTEEGKVTKREVPKIMKWDQLEDRKKA